MDMKLNKEALKQLQSHLFNFRKAFTVIIVLNMLFLLERSIFDFMGFMYGMIIADIFYLVFLIIGLFGAWQYRVNYVAASTILSLMWIAWNLFVICNYLNVGFLDRYDPVALNMNTNMKSWWFTSSFGCSEHIENRLEKFKYEKSFAKIKNTFTSTSENSTPAGPFFKNDTRPKTYMLENFIRANCVLPFYTIEIIHSGVLIFLSVLCVIFGLLLANAFNEDDEAFDYIGGFDSVHVGPNNPDSNELYKSNTNSSILQNKNYEAQAIIPNRTYESQGTLRNKAYEPQGTIPIRTYETQGTIPIRTYETQAMVQQNMNYEGQGILPQMNNSQIRLQPLYATNQNG